MRITPKYYIYIMKTLLLLLLLLLLLFSCTTEEDMSQYQKCPTIKALISSTLPGTFGYGGVQIPGGNVYQMVLSDDSVKEISYNDYNKYKVGDTMCK